jgi:chorismate synthase
MSANSFGTLLRLTTFGESHGRAIGGILEGMPAGMPVDISKIQALLDARRPGNSPYTSPRNEQDVLELLSGIAGGLTLGTPIGFIIKNEDTRPDDYKEISNYYRPSHSDYTWDAKFGIRDPRGGGRASARETTCRVVGGALAMQLLETQGISIQAWVSQIGKVKAAESIKNIPDRAAVYASPVRCPYPKHAARMEEAIAAAKREGDSLGGVILCVATGVPAGIGEPVFDKLHAEIGKALLSINTVKGFEVGSGFSAAAMQGSVHNDLFEFNKGKISTKTNYSGGIQGGISNGAPIVVRAAFKPVSSIAKAQEMIDKSGVKQELAVGGRHDVCVLPRAVPIVESMMALTLADMYLRSHSNRFDRL